MFVACESDEDIPYLMNYIGEDNLITGSDYGHHGGQIPTMEPMSFENRLRGGDPTGDLAVFAEILARQDISERQAEKILKDNPRHLYGI